MILKSCEGDLEDLRILIGYLIRETKSHVPQLPEKFVDALVEHISYARKLSVSQIDMLAEQRDQFQQLVPPNFEAAYRGLSNITTGQLKKLVGEDVNESGGVINVGIAAEKSRNKCWTLDPNEAIKFASDVYSGQETEDNRWMVIMVANQATHDQFILNYRLLAQEPGIGDWYHDRWKENLRKSILREKEVVACQDVEVDYVIYARNAKVLRRLLKMEMSAD